MKNIIFVGWVNQGKAPVDGETTKNQYIIAELQKYCKVTVLDFYEKNSHPWVYLQALWALLTMPKATIIFSTSAKNVYGMLKLFKRMHLKRNIIYWVIGGAFAKRVLDGEFEANVFNNLKYNLVQCHSMIDQLKQAGVTNARFVSNFKPIPYYPDLEKALAAKANSDKVRFVFLSRIMPDKGCDYILEAVRRLNANNLQHRFSVDFYGKLDTSYQEQFLKNVNQLENVAYHGLLDLRTKEGYDTLATYHAMLFPSYWRGEGFAGVFIDAFISGLPVLASDWAHNAEAITNKKLGLIYPVHNIESLTEAMEKCILGKIDLQSMSRNVRAEASKYESKNALSVDYLKSIGLVES